MFHDYQGRAVLVTGGTRGIGLAAGLSFARQGAHVYLTHRWGSADESEIFRRFEDAGATRPCIVEADVSIEEDTDNLLEIIKRKHDFIDAFVSNVCVVQKGVPLMEHKQRSLLQCLDYSSWPLMAYLQAIKTNFGRYPKYTVATSSDGPDSYYPHYDYVALSKAVLETFARYMSVHLRPERSTVNVVRTRQVITDSFNDMFGKETIELANRFPELLVSPEEVANSIAALCSGLLDAVSGQVVVVDRGAGFVDNALSLAHLQNGRPHAAE